MHNYISYWVQTCKCHINTVTDCVVRCKKERFYSTQYSLKLCGFLTWSSLKTNAHRARAATKKTTIISNAINVYLLTKITLSASLVKSPHAFTLTTGRLNTNFCIVTIIEGLYTRWYIQPSPVCARRLSRVTPGFQGGNWIPQTKGTGVSRIKSYQEMILV